MARTVPGSGAVIKPIFDEFFGVRAVEVKDGGSGYDPSDPPRLTIDGCGTPVQDALLYPIIDSDSGRIIHVRVLERGKGYDPLRLSILPEQETPNVVSSFDFNRIWQSHPNSPTSGVFQLNDQNVVTDRLRIQSDNHPKPSQYIQSERQPGGSGTIVDRTFDQVFVFRGGKDVPNPNDRLFQKDKSTAIMANGGLLHTPDWGTTGNSPVGFSIDSVKYDYLKQSNIYGAITDNNVYYYQSSKLINEFALRNGVFDWGRFEVFTWRTKVEFDNILLEVEQLDETLGLVEVGRIVDEVGGTAKGRVAKIVRNAQNEITKVYLREISGGSFAENDLVLGANGFQFRVAEEPIALTLGVFYIEFGEEANEFGPFTPGQYYFAPENIQVQRNYVIIWDQSDPSNQPSGEMLGHPMQFSTTPDGTHNSTPGTLYYNSTGVTQAPAADYENEYKSVFIMNPDETSRIYYYCKNHPNMSGYDGDEGYMTLSPVLEEEEHENNYYYKNYYQADSNDPNTIDLSRHPSGHSKVLGMSFDGYPIYGPWGIIDGTLSRETSSYRLRTTNEIQGARPEVVTASNVTYTVTVSNGKFQFNGSRPAFLDLDRGSTYIFNQDDSTNDGSSLLFSQTENGWHSTGDPTDIGDTSYLYSAVHHTTYHIDGSQVTYSQYISQFNSATTREIRFTPPVDAPSTLYAFSYADSDYGIRSVQTGYILGDLVEDYIYQEGLGTLDEFNGRFAVTPEYPNGTYAYFMTEDSSGNPVYPYAIGPKYYSVPLFENDVVPPQPDVFPTIADGDVVLTDTGSVSYIKMTKKGDNFFGPAKAKILGGEGSGATVSPVVQTITGLSLLNPGRSYATPPTLIFEGGGGGTGAQGAAEIDTLGKVTSIAVADPGEFYQEPPFVLITGGGGIGAKAEAVIDQGQVTAINVIDPGSGYVNPPNVIFTKLVNLKRKTNARQANNSEQIYLTGLVKSLNASDTTVYVDSTDGFPGSGSLILNTETITYTGKGAGRFTGLTRGVNFNYDQRVILDDSQNDQQGNSTYKFNVGDRVIRRVENANNKIAKVYDWNPATRELLVTFEVDELAFIDGGIPSTLDAIVQFDAGTAASAPSGFDPHVLVVDNGESIPTLTVPLGTIQNRSFEDNDENDGAGDGIADLVNTGTAYENQINLDGGIYNSLYGIEETQGGQNTTLFQVGDNIKDAAIPTKFATVTSAGALADGVEHNANLEIYLDANEGNGQNYSVNDVVTGSTSNVRATVVSWDPATSKLIVNNVIPYDTGNINVGIGGFLYEFSSKGTVVDFVVQNSGTNYTAAPTVAIENIGDVQATATVNMTTAGDQIESISVNNGGYGIFQNVDGTYNLHPTITFTNAVGDTTGSGAAAQAIIGGEDLIGNGGARYRIKRIEYQTILRS